MRTCHLLPVLFMTMIHAIMDPVLYWDDLFISICWAPFWHWPSSSTGIDFGPSSGTGTLTSPNWHGANLGCLVLEQGNPFRNWESNPKPKCNPNCTVLIWGQECPSAVTGIKISPSSVTGPVPKWGPTCIHRIMPYPDMFWNLLFWGRRWCTRETYM